MTSYLLDTNILLRFFAQDVPSEAGEVDILFARAQKGSITLEICEPVFIETIVTLRNYFKFPKEKVISLMEQILVLSWIRVENNMVLSESLSIYASNSLDFIDCLIYVRALKNKQILFTFDKKLKRLT